MATVGVLKLPDGNTVIAVEAEDAAGDIVEVDEVVNPEGEVIEVVETVQKASGEVDVVEAVKLPSGDVEVIEAVKTPSGEIVEVVEVVASEELREPKAFANTAAAVNVISNSVVEEPSFEAPIIIDLTSGLEEEEVLVTGDQPQIITFRSPQPVSNLGPVQKSNEVVSFTPLQQLDNISFEPFEVRA